MEIRTPVKGFTGEVVGVAFAGGVGHTDDPNRLAYFRRHGYEIVTEAESTPKKAEDMTKAELIAHAQANNIDLGDAKTKAEILAAVTAAAEQPAGDGEGQEPPQS